MDLIKRSYLTACYSALSLIFNAHPSHRRVSVLLMDIAVVLSAYALAFLLRFDFELSGYYLRVMVVTAPGALLIFLAAAHLFGLNRGLNDYMGFGETSTIFRAIGLAALLKAACAAFLFEGRFPRAILVMDPILCFLGIALVRAAIFSVRAFLKLRARDSKESRSAIIIGGGMMGEAILRQMQHSPTHRYHILGFIDDDASKWGMHIHGVSILGGRELLNTILRRRQVDELVIAIAARRGEVVGQAIELLRTLDRKPELKIVPSLEEMQGPKQAAPVRKVRPSDLLNRNVVALDALRIARSLENKTVLITGAGGTIGSELCRQVLAYGATRIILLENHATALFYRDAELKVSARFTQIVPVLGDVRDRCLVDRVFKEHRPNIVLHAAAHKHVHQLEASFNIQEGISNNLLGTYCLAQAAHQFGAESFLLVSTDKAVRPSSVMGATKRAAEAVVTTMAQTSSTKFSAVRFGNVLGSSGSVLKIFQEQIANGGPVTVTDPNVTRFFMTVEEGVGLILQSVAMAQGGEVFVLKMGSAVKIMDMAKQLILMSGLAPGRDIEIKVTGLKPGEKMDEELVEDPAGAGASDHADIMVLRGENDFLDDLNERILELELLSRGGNPVATLRRLQEFVPTYQPGEARREATEKRTWVD